MKKLFLVVLLVISFSMIGFSQSITFEKFFSENAVNQVIQTDDNGYILNCSGELRFVKLDQFGYMQWAKHYPHIINPGKEISKTIDGGYLAIGSVMNQGYEDICLVKLDTNFDTVWTKTFGYLGEIGFAAIQLPDSSIIFSSRLGSGSRLRKINSDGNIIWAQTFSGGLVSLKSYLVNLNNDKFIFGLRYHIYLMNSDGDILWNRGVNYNSPTFLTMDGYIFISTTAYLEKLDLNMNTIWQKNISNIVSLTYSNEGAYTAIKSSLYSPSPCSLLKIDTSGNIISEISFEERGQYISTTSDSGFIICGSINRTYDYEKYVTWLLKTDNNLNYNSIAIKDPLDADRLNIFDTYAITWKAKNVSYIDIDYSIDNKVTWNNLALQYSAIEDTFYWTVPGLPLGNLFLRVRDSFNQEIFDISDPALIATSYSAFDYIAANEILMWLRNDGMNAHNPAGTGTTGFLWPGGIQSTIGAIFQDGLVWGGKVNGETRVNGNTYRIGLIPGYILPSGLPSDPLEVKAKLFNIKKDWQSLPPGPRKSKYEFDYLNWPVDLGAPWEDNDGNGIYTPGIDNPRILGEETLFFVANDLNASRSTFTYGSNPIGLELQATTFGYNSELLKDVVFKKFKIINKSENDITDMYLSYWADVDLGLCVG